MALTTTNIKRAIYQDGDSKCELVQGIAFTNTDEVALSHNLGIVPDIVLISNTSAYEVKVSVTTAKTNANVYLTPSNAGATCDLVIKKIKGKAR